MARRRCAGREWRIRLHQGNFGPDPVRSRRPARLVVGSLDVMAIDAIRDGVLSLPEADRAELAAVLLASLGPEPESDQPEVEQTWALELNRRAAALDSGEDPGVSWEDALTKARQTLAE